MNFTVSVQGTENERGIGMVNKQHSVIISGQYSEKSV